MFHFQGDTVPACSCEPFFLVALVNCCFRLLQFKKLPLDKKRLGRLWPAFATRQQLCRLCSNKRELQWLSRHEDEALRCCSTLLVFFFFLSQLFFHLSFSLRLSSKPVRTEEKEPTVNCFRILLRRPMHTFLLLLLLTLMSIVLHYRCLFSGIHIIRFLVYSSRFCSFSQFLLQSYQTWLRSRSISDLNLSFCLIFSVLLSRTSPKPVMPATAPRMHQVRSNSKGFRQRWNGQQWRRMCEFEGCDREAQRISLCARHQPQRQWRSKRPGIVGTPVSASKLEAMLEKLPEPVGSVVNNEEPTEQVSRPSSRNSPVTQASAFDQLWSPHGQKTGTVEQQLPGPFNTDTDCDLDYGRSTSSHLPYPTAASLLQATVGTKTVKNNVDGKNKVFLPTAAELLMAELDPTGNYGSSMQAALPAMSASSTDSLQTISNYARLATFMGRPDLLLSSGFLPVPGSASGFFGAPTPNSTSSVYNNSSTGVSLNSSQPGSPERTSNADYATNMPALSSQTMTSRFRDCTPYQSILNSLEHLANCDDSLASRPTTGADFGRSPLPPIESLKNGSFSSQLASIFSSSPAMNWASTRSLLQPTLV